MTRAAGVACILLAAVIATCLPAPAIAQATTVTPSVLVMPLRPLGEDPRALWLGEGVALLVADALTSLGRPAVPRRIASRRSMRWNCPPIATCRVPRCCALPS